VSTAPPVSATIAAPRQSLRVRTLAARLVLAGALVAGSAALVGDLNGLLTYWVYAVVGAVLVIRRPRNSIGWLLLSLAFLWVAGDVTLQVSGAGLADGTAPLGERMIAWLIAISSLIFVAVYFGLAAVFPSGRLPGGSWGRAVRGLLAADVIAIALSGLAPTFSIIVADGTTVDALNPVGIFRDGSWWSILGTFVYVILAATFLIGAASLLVRSRRAHGIERQQLEWVALAVALAIGSVILGVAWTAATGRSDLSWLPAAIPLKAPPIAIGIAVMRYRLYDIDRIVSRTISYAGVTAVLVVVFAGAILVLQGVLAPLTGGNTVAVAASTLIVAALFQPLRRRIQSVVDHRFDRARYDADRTVTAFSERMRDAIDLPALAADLDGTIRQAISPSRLGIWLRGPRE